MSKRYSSTLAPVVAPLHPVRTVPKVSNAAEALPSVTKIRQDAQDAIKVRA